VFWVALFSTLAGLLYGAWVDGVSPGLLGLVLSAFLGFLVVAVWWVRNRSPAKSLNHPITK
jgi:uncharacterized membrane protein YdjX (TVP38/TMEM64 family)